MSESASMSRIARLERECAEIEESVGGFEKAQKEVNEHHKALHEYNESKDAAQILFGRLATMEGVTVKQIHEDYDLAASD